MWYNIVISVEKNIIMGNICIVKINFKVFCDVSELNKKLILLLV